MALRSRRSQRDSNHIPQDSFAGAPDQHSEGNSLLLSPLLCLTCFQADLFATTQPQDARPFKIFLSLLDKWEIGSQLTDTLILDALRAVMDLLRERNEESDDVSSSLCTGSRYLIT